MELNGFNAAAIEPAQTYEPLPAGNYSAVIVESEEKPTKAMTGSYLQLGLEIVEGQYAGRKLIDRLNLNNPNQIAVEIAQRTLSAICHATGVMTPKDSSELHDKPLVVKVAVKAADGQYSASNEIKGYSGAKTNGAATAAPAAAPQAAAAPPWKR